MENLGILKWRTWSAARKGMVIGALIAASVTICVEVALMKTQHANQNEFLGGLNYAIALTVGIPVNVPTGVIYSIMGWKCPQYININLVCVITMINVLIYGGTGGVVGYAGHWIVRVVKNFNKK